MTTIILPVFNAAAETSACLAALAESIQVDTSLLLIDDASTDPAIASLLEGFKQTRARTRLMRNERNLGFVATVNRAMRACDDDVLLLNSDTLPTPGFLDRIEACAASDRRIASVTPFSNCAEICSFPESCRANPVPHDLNRMAQSFAQEIAAEAIDLPTGVGFCLWMRRATIVEIGDFDEATFGRGYGEENDWCRRAAGHGWRNVLCPSAYVAHVGHASFAGTGEKPGGVNLQRLAARYPGYNGAVADFIARDPLAEIRARVATRLAQAAV